MKDFEKFYNKALRFLSYRPRSEKEIRDRLIWFAKRNKKIATAEAQNKTETQKFSASENFSVSVVAREASIIDKVIQKLKEQKFINDEEFAKWWIESRLRFRPRSINLIKRELLQKGVADETIEDQISKIKDQTENDLERAKKLVEKRMARFRNKFGMTREEIYQKLGRYLASKGFDWDTIKQSIDYVQSHERS